MRGSTVFSSAFSLDRSTENPRLRFSLGLSPWMEASPRGANDTTPRPALGNGSERPRLPRGGACPARHAAPPLGYPMGNYATRKVPLSGAPQGDGKMCP